jgi:hypothetical protein
LQFFVYHTKFIVETWHSLDMSPTNCRWELCREVMWGHPSRHIFYSLFVVVVVELWDNGYGEQ